MSKQASTVSKAVAIGGVLAISALFLGQSAKADAIRRYSEEDVRILQRVAPAYPAIAHQIHLSGMVILDMEVAEDGSVENASVVSGNPILSGGAVAAAKHWKFAPLTEDGKAVKGTVRVSFKFVEH
ncbi:MAG TPA: energy transducer TonB [Bryobacteraceae bacterium]|jgi:TonB family protein|nr:energy transducer TonB [Bryobacteraceae bacterium]